MAFTACPRPIPTFAISCTFKHRLLLIPLLSGLTNLLSLILMPAVSTSEIFHIQPAPINSSNYTRSTPTPPKETELLRIDLEHAICGQNINLREITILQLQQAFKTKKLTAEELVRCYLKRIELMNPFLNAVLEINPDALEIAKQLDKDRENGIYYGLLHGIPVLIKDSIGTADKMETTAGTIALLGLKPKEDAEVIKKLRKAGAIVIGKANLSEFGSFDVTVLTLEVRTQNSLQKIRGTNIPHGWSGRGGQTRNVYIRSADPCGSSSGSAVAVAANMVTVALGSETDGSIICPSQEAALVGLKPGVGVVSMEGAIGIAHTQDVIGPMTRTVFDAFILFSKIASSDVNFDSGMIFAETKRRMEYYVPYLRYPKIRLGVGRGTYLQNISTIYETIIMKLGVAGLDIIDPVEFDEEIQSNIADNSEDYVLYHEFKYGLNKYLRNSVIRPSSNTKIHTLADVIQFNIKNPPEEGYNQGLLISAQETNGLLNSTYLENKIKNKLAAQNYFDLVLARYSLDAILLPTMNWSIAAISGYPDITVPAGFLDNGLPFGISFYGGRGSEETLLEIALILENVHKGRRTSLFLD